MSELFEFVNREARLVIITVTVGVVLITAAVVAFVFWTERRDRRRRMAAHTQKMKMHGGS